MKFQTTAVITGAKSYNNTVDGTPHNFTKLYVMTDLSEQSGYGSATVEYKWGLSDNLNKIANQQFPFEAKIDMEIVTTGSRQTTIIHNVTPVSQKS